MNKNNNLASTWGKIFRCIAVFAATAAGVAANAADLEDFYFRHDFSSGTCDFSTGSSSTLASSPFTSEAVVALCGQDGADTASYPGSKYGTAVFGTDGAESLVNGDWTLAMSFRAAKTEGGVMFSIGRLNKADKKSITLSSSSTNGKLLLKTVVRDANGNRTVEGSAEATVADTQNAFHAVVLVFKAGETAGAGTFTLYVDGVQAAELETTSGVFGNSFQYGAINGGNYGDTGLSALSQSSGFAVQDVRCYTTAFTAEDAAAYAALYPDELPELSDVSAYAYVESFGVNAVDTGYLAQSNSAFTVDFQFTTNWKRQARIFGCYSKYTNNISEDGLSSGLYINGSDQLAYGVFSKFLTGGTWMALDPDNKITNDDSRYVVSLEGASNGGTSGTLTNYKTRELKSRSSNAERTENAIRSVYLFASNNKDAVDRESYAKIYSFSATEGSATAPAVFCAPAEKAGAAGFVDVVSGEFKGDIVQSPEPALEFQAGVGQASDYRCRSGKFYARVYAKSDDAAKGLVKFAECEEAGTNAQFVARGKTATIIAVPSAGYPSVQWSGDTWAIQSASNDGTEITVQSDTAAILTATFSQGAEWTDNDGTGSFDSSENWSAGAAPSAGPVTLNISGDTVLTVAGEYSLGDVTVKGTGRATFAGGGSLSVATMSVEQGLTVDGAGVLSVQGLAGEGDVVLQPASGDIAFSQETALTGKLTVRASASAAFTVSAATSIGSFVVDAGENCVVTLSSSSGGSFVAGAIDIAGGVLKLGSDEILGATPRINVASGGTLDVNAKTFAGCRETLVVHIAGAGAGNWPWAITSSGGNMPDYNYFAELHLDADATIGGANRILTGILYGLGYKETRLPLNLGGHTLTKTGIGLLVMRRPYPDAAGGTIYLKEGSGQIVTHSGVTAAYFTGTMSKAVDLKLGEGFLLFFTNENATKETQPMIFKNVESAGATVSGTAAGTPGIGVKSSFSGHGTFSNFTFSNNATFSPDGLGYFIVEGTLAGTLKVALDEEVKTGRTTIPLYKTASGKTPVDAGDIVLSSGTAGTRLAATEDGLGYDLKVGGLRVFFR